MFIRLSGVKEQQKVLLGCLSYLWIRLRDRKLLTILAGIKVTQKCFFMDWPVFVVPREDETLSPIREISSKLRGYIILCPLGAEQLVFFALTFVIFVPTNDDQNFFTSKEKKTETTLHVSSGWLHLKIDIGCVRLEGITNWRRSTLHNKDGGQLRFVRFSISTFLNARLEKEQR